MRIVLQRCNSASVVVSSTVVGDIRKGLVAFVGIEPRDTMDDVAWAARKIVNVKLFRSEDREKNWKTSAKQRDFGILLVSQFTLHARLKGNKPSFSGAARGDVATVLFDSLVAAVKAEHAGTDDRVQIGVFGAMMEVNVAGDGPVTLTLDSQEVGFPRKHRSAAAAAAAAAAPVAP
tara:strand:- start:104 stop:631 length:528 start_codon:yes stop_codon:yes gene_type:complete